MGAGAVLFAFIGLFFHRRFELIPFIVAGFAGAVLVWLFIDSYLTGTDPKKDDKLQPVYASKVSIVVLFGIWAFIQVTMPLRHYFIPGNVSWTEEGHRFAWHMKLRGKSGDVKFFAFDPATEDRYEINHKKNLKSWQYRKMVTRPYMIHQFAQYLDDKLRQEGKGHYEIRVEAFNSLNYRPSQPLIDPEVDLSKETYTDFIHNHWILHLDESLQPQRLAARTKKKSWTIDPV